MIRAAFWHIDTSYEMSSARHWTSLIFGLQFAPAYLKHCVCRLLPNPEHHLVLLVVAVKKCAPCRKKAILTNRGLDGLCCEFERIVTLNTRLRAVARFLLTSPASFAKARLSHWSIGRAARFSIA